MISEEYVNCKEKLKYICNKHNSQIQDITFDGIKRGHGCKYCGQEKVAKNNTGVKTNIKDIKQYLNNHGQTYLDSYIKKGRVYVSYSCKKHSDEKFERPWNNLMRSEFPCDKCRASNRFFEDFKRKIYQINDNIEILGEYINNNTEIECYCKIHKHNWFSTPSALKRNPYCHKCSCTKSKSEILVEQILNKYNIEYETQKRYSDCKYIRPLPFDFYLVDYNILIEFDGEHHYRIVPRGDATNEELEEILKDVIKKDKIKTKYCIKNNIPLIRIPYWERNHMEYYLLNELKNYNINIAIPKVAI